MEQPAPRVRAPLRDVHTNAQSQAGRKVELEALTAKPSVGGAALPAAAPTSIAPTVAPIAVVAPINTPPAVTTTDANAVAGPLPSATVAAAAAPLPPVAALTGEQLMALAQQAHAAMQSAPASAAPTAPLTLTEVLGAELQHEVVSLRGRELVVQWGNLRRFQAAAEATQPTMVVSFLGDTSVGKSTTIGELMSGDSGRPFVQRGRGQTCSTTNNVNLYPCRSLAAGLTVNFLDFEGEGGSESFVASAQAASGAFSAHAMRILGLDAEEASPRGETG